MAALPEYIEYGSQTRWINRLLMTAGLPPISSADTLTIPEHSDAGIAHQTLNDVFLSTLARGWWFNSTYREEFTPSGLTNEIEIIGALHARASAPRPGEMPPPEYRIEFTRGQSSGRLYNVTDKTYTFDAPVCLDVIRITSKDQLPMEFSEYCLLKATRLFAGHFGVNVDRTDEELAWRELDRKDAELHPTPNMFLNPETYAQVHR